MNIKGRPKIALESGDTIYQPPSVHLLDRPEWAEGFSDPEGQLRFRFNGDLGIEFSV
jgi:hypothetical protein